MRICDSARIKGKKRVGYGFTDGVESRWRSVKEVDQIGNDVVALLLRHCRSDANGGCCVYPGQTLKPGFRSHRNGYIENK